jgi:RNA polymerase sigma factor (TIGR02999 family)
VPEKQPITLLLQAFASGDKSALDEVLPLVYAELRKLANGYLRRERSSHTLQPTALVHEAYIRLVRQDSPDYRSRAHFLAVAATVMRQVLIDHARARGAGKRGGGQLNYSLDDARDAPSEQPLDMLAVEDALQALERKDPGKAKLIELRFFGGLTLEEMVEVTGSPADQVRAELRVAQAWLNRRLAPERAGSKNLQK